MAAANNPPTSVPPDATVQAAITLMLLHDFSQLPVMTNQRDVKGVISWASIGSRFALGKAGTHVRDLMDPHHEVRADESLFSAITLVSAHGYVLVRGSDNSIKGIITATDLSLQFRQLAEPFLLLGEIENHVRRMIVGRFTLPELRAAKDPADESRQVDSVADLNFGEYRRLLEKEENWGKLGARIDRATFIKKLDEVRDIRNDVMHFDPDPVGSEQLDALRDFARFLLRLQVLGAT